MRNATPSATTPQALIAAFGEALNRGDLDTLVAFYEPEAVFKAQPDRVVHGLPAIREALGEFVALRPQITSTVKEVFEAGATALLFVDWELTGRGPDGQSITMGGRSADVLRRQPDGGWKISVDNPYGPDSD